MQSKHAGSLHVLFKIYNKHLIYIKNTLITKLNERMDKVSDKNFIFKETINQLSLFLLLHAHFLSTFVVQFIILIHNKFIYTVP